jgi:hypothetical protein
MRRIRYVASIFFGYNYPQLLLSAFWLPIRPASVPLCLIIAPDIWVVNLSFISFNESRVGLFTRRLYQCETLGFHVFLFYFINNSPGNTYFVWTLRHKTYIYDSGRKSNSVLLVLTYAVCEFETFSLVQFWAEFGLS